MDPSHKKRLDGQALQTLASWKMEAQAAKGKQIGDEIAVGSLWSQGQQE